MQYAEQLDTAVARLAMADGKVDKAAAAKAMELVRLSTSGAPSSRCLQ